MSFFKRMFGAERSRTPAPSITTSPSHGHENAIDLPQLGDSSSFPATVTLPSASVSGPGLVDERTDESVVGLVWLSPGTFLMGSPSGEWERRAVEEGPQTQVTLSKGYWLGKFPIKQSEWECVMGTNPSAFKKAGGPSAPVEDVSWDDAMAFCQKLNERESRAGRLPEGYTYKLPTEAQWEYACRAGSTGAYAGLDPNINGPESVIRNYVNGLAWYDLNSQGHTQPVGQKLPNAWGLFDMHGNVWEWCLDWHGAYPGGAVSDHIGLSPGRHRILRGGSWENGLWQSRSAHRTSKAPGERDMTIGFRVALSSFI